MQLSVPNNAWQNVGFKRKLSIGFSTNSTFRLAFVDGYFQLSSNQSHNYMQTKYLQVFWLLLPSCWHRICPFLSLNRSRDKCDATSVAAAKAD